MKLSASGVNKRRTENWVLGLLAALCPKSCLVRGRESIQMFKWYQMI